MRQYTNSVARFLRRFQYIYTVDLEQGSERIRSHLKTEKRIAAILDAHPSGTREGGTTAKRLEPNYILILGMHPTNW